MRWVEETAPVSIVMSLARCAEGCYGGLRVEREIRNWRCYGNPGADENGGEMKGFKGCHGKK